VDKKPIILVFVDYYLPGYGAGGPLRSIGNLVTALSAELCFKIVTRSHDLRVKRDYSDVKVNAWNTVPGASVYYISSGLLRPWRILRMLLETEYDALYLNSLFSPQFSILPTLFVVLRSRRRRPLLIATRGELFDGALAIKSWRKALYLAFARTLGLYQRVIFHASTEAERAAIIRRVQGDRVVVSPILVAPDLAQQLPVADASESTKTAGALKIICVARVARNKNQLDAIRILRRVVGAVELDLYGPIHDPAYWDECRREMDSLPANIKVRHCGVLPANQMEKVLSAYHLFFLPTHGENFGHAIVEALGAGVPVLISDRTPWTNLENSRAGFAMTLSDHQPFVQVLQQFVEMSDLEHRQMRASARQFALRWATLSNAVESNRELFQELLRRR
jgi:glycosyltransferase involved in cell wall biosynthesis